MASNLTFEEIVNLQTFSTPEAVANLYNKVGFTKLEEQIVKKYFDHKGRVLDLGCGTGRTSLPFSQRGFQVTGTDLSKEMVEYAKKKHKRIDFRLMDACNLDFEDESFDYVFFSFNGIDCIHPYRRRLQCINEARRVLKQKGLFVFSSHNALCLPKNGDLIKVFITNCINLRIFGKYRIEHSPTGTLYLYYGVPFMEKGVLERMGFVVHEMIGNKHKDNIMMMLWELSPYYISQKV